VVVVVVVVVLLLLLLLVIFLFTPLCRPSSLFRPNILIQSPSRSSSVSASSLIILYNPFRDYFICHSIHMVCTMLSSCYFVLILFYILSQYLILHELQCRLPTCGS